MMIARVFFALLLLGLLFGGIFGWKHHQAGQAAAHQTAPPPATVTSATVQVETWPNPLFAVGTLTAHQDIQLSTEVAGQIRALHFESGQTVRQGTVLLELDDTVDQSELAGFMAERQLTQIEFERIRKLRQEGSASQSSYDQAKAELDNANAKVTAQQSRIAQKKIKAPFSGQLGLRQVSVGTYLAEGAAIIALQTLNPIQVDFSLPERYLSQIQLKQTITLQVPAYPQVFEGQITAINPAIEVNSRTIRVRAALDNSEQLLRPGMSAQVQIQQPAQTNLLTLPRTAITFNPYGSTAFVITPKDQQTIAVQRQVTTGREHQQRIEIVQGLTAGETVVDAGHVKLRNGQAIQVVAPTANPAAQP